MALEYYAHSIEGKPVDEWHRLEEHLKGTAELAASFATEFGCGEWGRLAGSWHDLGKGDKWIFMLMETRVRS